MSIQGLFELLSVPMSRERNFLSTVIAVCFSDCIIICTFDQINNDHIPLPPITKLILRTTFNPISTNLSLCLPAACFLFTYFLSEGVKNEGYREARDWRS